MENNNTKNEMTIDGCKVIDNGNGLSSFIPCKDEHVGFFAKIINWFRHADIKPYVKVRDLADPFNERLHDVDDIDAGSDGKLAVEAGIKMSF